MQTSRPQNATPLSPFRTSFGAVGLTAALTALAFAGAGVSVRVFARRSRTRRSWWVGSAVAVAGALASAGSPTPVAAALAGAGLAAAAVVDGIEGRVPTVLAHGTTALSAVLLLGHGAVSGHWGPIATAAVLTTALVAGFAVVWLAGGMGFGDVRLVGGTATALTSGAGGLVVLVVVTAVAGAIALARQRALGRRDRQVPLGPPLVMGWLVAIWTA